ncbi:TIGR02234 family membrane protein [uncultured Mycolicibacterium sp.]|uniref:TIGR02234 family membrane protein n=1 Tax=uncultured Mycolicibacterium sp. TaxID=2320817 RepID=UPI0026280446|nr:TIGR02234 family membrane protein [uncultured Mycolicibacterium sp.]
MIRVAQLLLVVAAAALWAASRVGWVQITTFDGLTHPKTVTLSGATWSTALVPLALVALAAAVAALAVRGLMLRLLAVLVALASAGTAYLAISQWVVKDVAPRAARLVEAPVAELVGSHRFYGGAVLTLVAAVCTLAGAVLLMRAAAGAAGGAGRYAAPGARRAAARGEGAGDEGGTGLSERMIWDALDEGRDPTNPDTEGR